jgi:hypothetical protein
MVVLAAFCIGVASALALVFIRRALPILIALATGWLAWSLSHDFAVASVLLVASLLVVCWVLDAAANDWDKRRLSVGAEIAAGVLVAGGVAFLSAGGPSPNAVWIVAGSAIAAMAIVARWRRLSF